MTELDYSPPAEAPERVDIAQLSEARLLLRYAARSLGPSERAAVAGFLTGETQQATGARIGLTKGGVFMAREAAFRKMLRELVALDIYSPDDLLGGRRS